ncbi:MAG: hypothetical protein LN569_06470 [Rickettsia endosymbiont of Labidopullus appendiculatus]|nr:hypothetical protein [Rickettsia endosymbiont of Labidopullus appendiculatus]
MLNFIKKLTIILIALTFSGCQSSRIPGQSSNLVLNNEKALIVFTASLKSSSFPSDSSSASTHWENINKEDEIFPSESATWEATSAWDYVLYTYIVNPGEYNLKRINSKYFTRSEFIYTIFHVENLINNLLVNGGDVIYLGDITFHVNGDMIDYTVSDKYYDKIYKDIEKKFPMLIHKLKKRILSNSPNRSMPSKIIAIEEETEKLLH